MSKLRVVTLDEVRKFLLEQGYVDPDYVNNPDNGIMALVCVHNFGYFKDGKTKWYTFELGGEECIFFKR